MQQILRICDFQLEIQFKKSLQVYSHIILI